MTRLSALVFVDNGAGGWCIGQDAVGRRGLIHYTSSKGEPGDGSRRDLDGGGIWGTQKLRLRVGRGLMNLETKSAHDQSVVAVATAIFMEEFEFVSKNF